MKCDICNCIVSKCHILQDKSVCVDCRKKDNRSSYFSIGGRNKQEDTFLEAEDRVSSHNKYVKENIEIRRKILSENTKKKMGAICSEKNYKTY